MIYLGWCPWCYKYVNLCKDINGNNINRAFQPNQVQKIPSWPHQQGPDIQHGPQGQPAKLPPTTSRRNAHHIMALFNLINVLIMQMLNKNKNSSFLKQVVVGGIGGAAGGMLLKYDMKTSVFIGVVSYVAHTNFFDSKGGGGGGAGGSVGTYNELHRNQ